MKKRTKRKKEVDQKTRRWTRKVVQKRGMSFCKFSSTKDANNKRYFTKHISILGFIQLFFILILEKVYDLTFVVIEKVCNFLVFIIEKVYLSAEIFKIQTVMKRQISKQYPNFRKIKTKKILNITRFLTSE